MDGQGYILIYRPKHPNATQSGYLPEQRFLMSEHLGRPLVPGEIVHHINEDKLDNRITNLELVTRAHHAVVHGKNHRKPLLRRKRCPTCGELFRGKTRGNHRKVKYCSRRCFHYRRRPGGFVPKQCAHCGKDFLPTQPGNYDKVRYCSVTCASARFGPWPPKTCGFCGKKFSPKYRQHYKRAKYCNRECAWAAQRSHS